MEREGEAGRRSATRKELTLAFGMYQYEGDPEVIAMMLARPRRRCAG